MSKPERDQIMGHADDNDGIEEYDNPLPDWWLGLFLFTIVWAVGYTVDYHFLSQRSQEASYEAELAAAKIRWPAPDATTEGPLVTADRITAGQQVYAQNCVGCHAADLSGGIGPNLIDGNLVHGGTFEAIRHIIEVGVPEKGMLAWGPILGPERVTQVAAYVWDAGPRLEQEADAAPAEVQPVEAAEAEDPPEAEG